MLTVSDVSLRFSDRKLFDDVNINFTAGNTYGLILRSEDWYRWSQRCWKINISKNFSWRYRANDWTCFTWTK